MVTKGNEKRCFNSGNQEDSGDERNGIQCEVRGVLTGCELGKNNVFIRQKGGTMAKMGTSHLIR